MDIPKRINMKALVYSFEIFVCVCVRIYIYIYIQCNPDIRELSGHENKYLISGFGLFCLGNTGSNLGPDKSLLYQSFSYIRVRLYIVIHTQTVSLYHNSSVCG